MTNPVLPKISDLMAAWLGREDHTDSPFLRDPVTGKMQLRYDELRFKRMGNVDSSVVYQVELLYKNSSVHTYRTDAILPPSHGDETLNLPGLTGLVDIISTS
jgi:hypothetical protein